MNTTNFRGDYHNTEFSLGTNLSLAYLSKDAMNDMPFKSFLAAIHPRANTTPLIAGLMFAISSKFEKNGGSYGLRDRFSSSIQLFPNISLKLFDSNHFVEILSRDEILTHFDEKFGGDSGKLELAGGIICATEQRFLLSIDEDCSPYGEETKISFMLRDLKAEWRIVDLKNRLALFAPSHFSSGEENLMSAIMGQVLKKMNTTAKIIGGKAQYSIGFRRPSGSQKIYIQANRSILEGSRIEINGKVVLSFVDAFKSGENSIAYFQAKDGKFDLRKDIEGIEEINVRLVVKNLALTEPKIQMVNFDIRLNDSFFEAAKYYLGKIN